MEAEDPLWREEYAAGFKLDQWGRFHELDGSETDRAYQRVRTLREQYGRYQGQGEGQPPGLPSTIRLPHTKGTTSDKDMTPAESDLAGSERWESGPEEGEVQQEEDDDPEPFTQMRSRDTDTESEDTTPGRDSWRSARGREAVLLTTPRTRGRGKRHMDRGGGAAKRSRMESSSSDRRDESQESRSGGNQERPGRGGRRAARPMTPPHRPPPPSPSPSRSPRLSQPGSPGDFRRLLSLQSLTGGRLTPAWPVRMSADDTLVGRPGVRRITDGRAEVGGPGQGNPRHLSC